MCSTAARPTRTNRRRPMIFDSSMQVFHIAAAFPYVVYMHAVDHLDIRPPHAGISEMYQLWEVSREYCLMQSKAMQALTEFIVGRAPGGESTVQVLEENRFTFFDTPGISMIPALFEAVADECSHVLEAGGGSACSRRAEGSEEQGEEGEQLSRDSAIARRSFQQANGILDMFQEHFDQALKLLPPSAIATGGSGVAAAAGAGQFTRAEDALLLNGLKRFGCDESSWERIRVHVLPTKRSLDIKARYKRLISRRHEEDNDVKTWKLSLAEGLSQEETELLQKGVQYFGTRFDLIAEKVMKNRSETELRQAYTKLLSKLARTSKPATRAASSAMPSGCQGVLASSAVTAEDSTGGDSRVERGATGDGVGDGSKRRGAAKKKGFHSDLLADRSPDVKKRRRLQSAGVRSLYQLPEDEDADEDDFEHEVFFVYFDYFDDCIPPVHTCVTRYYQTTQVLHLRGEREREEREERRERERESIPGCVCVCY